MKVMIGAPVRNRAWVLPRFIEGIKKNMDVPHETHFIVNDCTDETENILLRAGMKVHHFDLLGMKTPTELRGTYSYTNLAFLRNKLLEAFLESDCTHLFSCDTDIVIPEGSLRQLVEADKDIISMIIKNHPKIRAHNILNNYRHIQEDIEEGVIPVDITGAVYLIKREVIEAGVRYGHNRQGEDVYFCDEARKKGFGLHCDTRLQPIHVYNQHEDLKAQLKRS